MKKLSKIARGVELQKSNIGICEVCQDSKQARRPFKNDRTRATRPLEIVHTDLVKVETPTYDKKKYFITCLDDFTHYTQVNDESIQPILSEINSAALIEASPQSVHFGNNITLRGDDDQPQPEPEEQLERGHRDRRLPIKLDDHVLFNDSEDYGLLSYQQAISGKEKSKWKEAIREKKEVHVENSSWKLVDRSGAKGKKIISSRWIFKIEDDGRYRARLVVQGCQQRGVIDYNAISSPVVGTDNLRTLIAFVAMKNFSMMKFDVQTAFSSAELNKDIYMSLPEGYERANKVCKLQKSLYGSKQAPALLKQKLTNILQKHGLMQLNTEQCVFVDKDRSMVLAIHIYDGLLAGSDNGKMKKLLNHLQKEFEIKIDENPYTYLGITFSKSCGNLKLSQGGNAQQVVDKYRMTDAKPTSTPLVVGSIHNPDTSEDKTKEM
ncbi:hypothetical protein JTB14_025992 [Gonioctena quinquepunctata]|nr:hypothetical protein JTB14_025992 [Gonioctena quinquepunctata]